MKTSRPRDTGHYIDFIRRVIRAAAERVGDADVEQLRDLISIRQELDVAIAIAAAGVHESGASWAEIGAATNTSRQAAWEKWGGVAKT